MSPFEVLSTASLIGVLVAREFAALRPVANRRLVRALSITAVPLALAFAWGVAARLVSAV